MMANAVILCALSAVGLGMTWKKLPEKVRTFMLNHPLIVDIVTFLVTYVTLGASLTALTAGALVTIVTSAMLHVATHQDQFQWVINGMNYAKEQLSSVNAQLNQQVKNYFGTKQVVVDAAV